MKSAYYYGGEIVFRAPIHPPTIQISALATTTNSQQTYWDKKSMFSVSRPSFTYFYPMIVSFTWKRLSDAFIDEPIIMYICKKG